MLKRLPKVAIAMSGGVDSSVAAALLKKQGYNCLGIFMKFWSETQNDTNNNTKRHSWENKCCSAEAFLDARRVCQKLKMPIYTLNFQAPFKKTVVDNFLKQYQTGLTPNPCIRCNQFIKFDLLLKKAKMLGCQYLATGHYARLRREIPKSKLQIPKFKLLMAKDKNKDQSYFLYTLTQKQLKNILFPIGDYTKTEVRKLAKKFGLPVYQKPESQEICFIAEKYPDNFLKRYLKLKSGPIITVEGKKIGGHQGLPIYTLGQRRGIKIGGIGPFYVVKKDFKKNTLIVTNKVNDPALFSGEFLVKDMSWVAGRPPQLLLKCWVRIRHQAPLVECLVTSDKRQETRRSYLVELKKPIRAITPGQSAVFYQGEEVLAGGVIAMACSK